ncbi:MAG: hypothetical protein ACI9QQ_000795 [Myxococcota bacterium]|jgi:hypothetical protein
MGSLFTAACYTIGFWFSKREPLAVAVLEGLSLWGADNEVFGWIKMVAHTQVASYVRLGVLFIFLRMPLLWYSRCFNIWFN